MAEYGIVRRRVNGRVNETMALSIDEHTGRSILTHDDEGAVYAECGKGECGNPSASLKEGV